MSVYSDVMGQARDRVPPIRNIAGEMTRKQRVEIAGTHAFTAEGEVL
jgi:hypothetical protein